MVNTGITGSFKVAAFQYYDGYKMALCTEPLPLSTPNYDAIQAIEVQMGNGYETGGKPLANPRITLEGNTAVLSFDNMEWPNSSFGAHSALIYDTLSGDNTSVAVIDFGNTFYSQNSTFTFVPTDGIIRIS